MTEPTFLTYEQFNAELGRSSGLLLFMLTSECDDSASGSARELNDLLDNVAVVHIMCAPVASTPTIVYYQGGDGRPLLSRTGPEAIVTVRADVEEARRRAETRSAEEARARALAESRTEAMLATEQVDRFPPFFRMARTLARDAWQAARETAEGAPLLLDADSAAARLQVCEQCPSLRGDRCVECGCYMLVKAHIAATDCPLRKWPDRSTTLR